MTISDTFRTPLDSLEYFALLVVDEAQLPLVETAANIAQIPHPELSPADVTYALDLLIEHACHEIPLHFPSVTKINRLNKLLYEEIGFKGLKDDQLDQIDFSCINKVLTTKYGSSTILSIIYLEIAHALELQARCAIFPDHTLVKIRLLHANGQPAEVVINPLSGQSLSADDLQKLFTPFKNKHGLIDEYDIPYGLFLETASKKDIIANVLHQISFIYQKKSTWGSLIRVLDRCIILQPDLISNYRERGYAFIKNGQPKKAIPDLEHYLQYARTQLVADTDLIALELTQIRNTSSHQ